MLNEKYPISNWITSRDQLLPGDKVAYFCEMRKAEVIAEYVGFPDEGKDTLLICRVDGMETAELVDHWDTIVYKIEQAVRECTCGAKYTTLPQVHLKYCDMGLVESFWKRPS